MADSAAMPPHSLCTLRTNRYMLIARVPMLGGNVLSAIGRCRLYAGVGPVRGDYEVDDSRHVWWGIRDFVSVGEVRCL